MNPGYNVLSGSDVEVQVSAHWVVPLPSTYVNTDSLHTWITISSLDSHGAQHSYTLSFEPRNGKLVAVFNQDLQSAVTPYDDRNVLVPIDLNPPMDSISHKDPTMQEIAARLTSDFIRYNNSEKYTIVPADKGEYNSNSAVSTILTRAGYNVKGMQVTFNNDPLNYFPSVTIPCAGWTIALDAPDVENAGTVLWAPGWGESYALPSKDFLQFGGVKNVISQITTNPVQAILNSPYARNLILTNDLGEAFTGDLNRLSKLVAGVEKIKQGGVLNILSGGLDLAQVGVAAGILPQFLNGIPIEQALKNYSAAVQTLSGLSGIYADFEQGGISGAIAAGSETDLLLWEAAPYIQQIVTGGLLPFLEGTSVPLLPTAALTATFLPIAVAVGLIVLVLGGNHDDPADMPDKYDTARFTQYVGELQGSAGTAYAPPYDPMTDPVQSSLGGLPMLQYIEDWTKANLNSSNTEIQRLAQQLDAQYGVTGNGALSFQTDIGNEAVVGGSLSGTYVSLHDAAGQAVGEIQILEAEVNPTPAETYGGLQWTAFMLPSGETGYWAPDGSGQFYYFGPDGTLYHDAYSGVVKATDLSSNAIGNVASYEFPPASDTLPLPAQDYGSLTWTAFTLQSGGIGYWATDDAGAYYYFGPDGTLYHDAYAGQVQPGDLSNAVGNVATYQFA